MSTPGMSPLDDELLSAYLDGALSQTERAALEQRLASDPALSAELADLRRIAVILRAAPELTPPRNFTLDPAIYHRRPVLALPIRWLRVSVALAAAILLIAFVVLTRTSPPSTAGSLVALAPSAAPPSIVPSIVIASITPVTTPAFAAKVPTTSTLAPMIPSIAPSIAVMQAAAQNALVATTIPAVTALRVMPAVIATIPLPLTKSPTALNVQQTPQQTPMAANAAQSAPVAPVAPSAGIESNSSDSQQATSPVSVLIAIIRFLLMLVGL